MIRPVLTEVLLFLLPFLAYGVFLVATRRGLLDPASWPLKRVGSLVIVALALAIAGFGVLASYGSPPDTIYIPAHVDKNGKLVPGKTVPRPK
jgi:Family of unknown function (DUF6111)